MTSTAPTDFTQHPDFDRATEDYPEPATFPDCYGVGDGSPEWLNVTAPK